MRYPFVTICLFSIASLCAADIVQEFPIWPGLAPGTEDRVNEEFIENERFKNIYQPSLTAHLPPQELSNGTAVLICSGGGYHHLAIYKEGHHTASRLNALGITVFVLKYRLDPEEALQDTLQSMTLIRERASEWAIDPQKLGLMGFSAGGHLLLNTVSHSTAETKPDFLVVMYPVIRDIDLENAFPSRASPAFICGASDDTTTPPTNAIAVYQSLIKAEIPAELHLYETGGHGFGLGLHRGPVVDWTRRLEVWLVGRGLLSRDSISAN